MAEEKKKDEANVDLMSKDATKGDVAQTFRSSGRLDFNRMRPILEDNEEKAYVITCNGDPSKHESYKKREINANAATLRRDEWKQLDAAILEATRIRLGGVSDLESKGLVFNIGNAMGTTVLEYHDINDAMIAGMSMDGLTRGDADRPVFTTNYLPLPIIHVDFELNQRVLEASRSLGNPLDTTMVEQATRRILEKREQLLFTAASTAYAFGGGTIYGYLDEPNRNQVSLDSNWDDSAASGADIVADVVAAKQASINAGYYGPWMLYIPTNFETKLDKDYSSSYPKSIRSRIMEIDGIAGISVSDTLTADNVILVQMTTDVVRLVRGMPIRVVQWSQEGGLITKFKVMTIQVPQVRSEQAGNSGVVHLS